jgi:hypothetical protein
MAVAWMAATIMVDKAHIYSKVCKSVFSRLGVEWFRTGFKCDLYPALESRSVFHLTFSSLCITYIDVLSGRGYSATPGFARMSQDRPLYTLHTSVSACGGTLTSFR